MGVSGNWNYRDFRFRLGQRTTVEFTLRCECGKKMTEDEGGYYCKTHGLQAYVV